MEAGDKAGLPAWAEAWLAPGDAERVERAVREAEKRCKGEFVPVLVRQSAGSGHVPHALAMMLIAAFFLALWRGGAGLPDSAGWVWALACSLGLYVLAAILGRSLAVRRLLTPREDRERAAFRRARVEFFQNQLQKTSGHTGVLIFVSLMERRCVVLADRSVASKVAPEAWESVVRKVIAGIRRGDLAGGYCDGLAEAAEIVRPHFPRRSKPRPNELKDRLVVKD